MTGCLVCLATLICPSSVSYAAWRYGQLDMIIAQYLYVIQVDILYSTILSAGPCLKQWLMGQRRSNHIFIGDPLGEIVCSLHYSITIVI